MAISVAHKYFTVQAKAASIDLDKYFHDPQVEILHQFRVEIKKIRAVLFHLENLPGWKPVKKNHRQVKYIFSKAGEIRELQVEMAWLNKHRKFNLLRFLQYESKLRKSEQRFHKKILSMLATFKKVCSKMEHRLAKLTQQQTNQYISEKWQFVLKLLLANIDQTHWHETRKQVKQLVYARQWISEETILPKKVMSIFHSLDKLQNSIGSWHDLDLMAIKLQHIEKKIAGNANLQREQQLALKKLLSDKKNLARRIQAKLSKIQILIREYK
jgi:CHAD domain-containing protein